MSDLFSARVHLGHRATNVDPRMKDFVFGVCEPYSNYQHCDKLSPTIQYYYTVSKSNFNLIRFQDRFNTAIIDLDQTAVLLRQALNFLAHLTSRGGLVLFVVRQPHLVQAVEAAAKGPYL